MQQAATKRRKTEAGWSGEAAARKAEELLGTAGGEVEDDGAQEPEIDDGLSKEERR